MTEESLHWSYGPVAHQSRRKLAPFRTAHTLETKHAEVMLSAQQAGSHRVYTEQQNQAKSSQTSIEGMSTHHNRGRRSHRRRRNCSCFCSIMSVRL